MIKNSLLFLALLTAYASAELPITIKDSATRKNLEYLDSKVSKAQSSANATLPAVQSITNPGYIKIGSVIYQWGTATTATAASGQTVAVTYPIAFTTGVFTQLTANGGVGRFGTVTSPTVSGFTLYQDNYGNTGTGTGWYWFAIGY